MWNELWPPLAIFAVYALLLHDYWIGPTRLPLHDSLHIYENFAVAYNHFFETGALPQWLPYSSSYGISNYPDNVMNIPPFYLVTLVAGAALDIKNTWSLFECALALDVAFFTLGSYLLARQFSSRGAATVITAGIVWMLVLDWNFYFTLRLVALMPLALFFLVQWARRESLVSLSLAVATVLLGCLGVPQYFAPFYALFYLSCTVALWVADRPALRVPNLLAFAGIGLFAIAAAGAVAYLYVASIRGLYFVTSARDLTTAKADLDVFLNYGGLQVLKVLEPFVAVPTENKTALFYAGSVVTVLTLYAFWRVRTRELWAFTVLLGVFILFCWGPYSPVARLAYYFPGMSYFRHVGLMYAVPKVLLGIIAAIGLGSVLGRLNASRGDLARVSFVIGVVSIAIAAAYFPLAELINRVFVVWDRPSSIMLLVAAVGGFGAVGLIFSKAKTTARSTNISFETIYVCRGRSLRR
jgi:hypothetical protein